MPVAVGIGGGRCRCGIARCIRLHGVDDAVLGFRFACARRLRRDRGSRSGRRCGGGSIRCARCVLFGRCGGAVLRDDRRLERRLRFSRDLRRRSRRARCLLSRSCRSTQSAWRRPRRPRRHSWRSWPRRSWRWRCIRAGGAPEWRPHRWRRIGWRQSLPRQSPAARSPCRSQASQWKRSPSPSWWEWRSRRRWPSRLPCRPVSCRSDRSPQRCRRKMHVDPGLVSSAFEASGFDASDFDLERRVLSVLSSALASSRAAAAAASRSSESLRVSLRAALSDAAVLSRDRLSGGGGSSARRGAGAGALDASWERLSLLPLLAAALLSTRAAKLSFPFDGSESDRADLAGVPRKDWFADTSDVTLTTCDPRNEPRLYLEQGPGHAPSKKLLFYFNYLRRQWEVAAGPGVVPFSARRQDLPSLALPRPLGCKPFRRQIFRLIASREYGLY